MTTPEFARRSWRAARSFGTGMFEIYVAAPLSMRLSVLDGVTLPASAQVRARWLELDGDPADAEFERRAWNLCLEDIAACDAVLGVVRVDLRTPGVHFELGYATALGKPVVLVAPAAPPYHALPGVIRVDDIDEAIRTLDRMQLARVPGISAVVRDGAVRWTSSFRARLRG